MLFCFKVDVDAIKTILHYDICDLLLECNTRLRVAEYLVYILTISPQHRGDDPHFPFVCFRNKTHPWFFGNLGSVIKRTIVFDRVAKRHHARELRKMWHDILRACCGSPIWYPP